MKHQTTFPSDNHDKISNQPLDGTVTGFYRTSSNVYHRGSTVVSGTNHLVEFSYHNLSSNHEWKNKTFLSVERYCRPLGGSKFALLTATRAHDRLLAMKCPVNLSLPGILSPIGRVTSSVRMDRVELWYLAKLYVFEIGFEFLSTDISLLPFLFWYWPRKMWSMDYMN